MEEVIFGRPFIEALPKEIEKSGAKRVFLICSKTLSSNTNEIQKLRKAVGSKLVGQFDCMGAHTYRNNVIAASKEIRKVSADILVTFGGGSVTDGAKAVTLCLANDIFKAENIDALRTRRTPSGHPLPPNFAGPKIKQISIPTTLSAAEFSAIAGVTNQRTNMKDILSHPDIMPRTVILDPSPTTHTPEWLFLSTGIRAIDHCVEGICSKEAHAFGDALAMQGLTLLARGLPLVKSDPGNLAARLDCQLGSWLSSGPLVSGVPMGASHGIGYVLGANFGVPHGHTSCIILPAVMRWNKTENSERQQLVSSILRNVEGAASYDASSLLDNLITNLGMPRNLSAVGITHKHFQKIAEQAMFTPWVPHNPRPIMGPPEIIQILQLAA